MAIISSKMGPLKPLFMTAVLAGVAVAASASNSKSEEDAIVSGSSVEVEAAKLDVAERMSVSVDEVKVVLQQPITWRNGALGCEKPGMSYTMSLVPGERLVLAVGQREFNYHRGSHDYFYCDRPTQTVAAKGGGYGSDI